MKIISWNVNGIRACVKKGFLDWLATQSDCVIGLQEVRARTSDLKSTIAQPSGWATHFFEGEKAGYSGVGLYSTWAFDEVHTSLDEERFDREGRVQIARLGKLRIVNVYFPNGGRDLSRVDYKLDFYARLLETLQPHKDEPMLIIGDYNTAHKPIDLARPKPNEKHTGFLPEEREVFQGWLDAGLTDTFRHFYPEQEGAYSWWSYFGGARKRNVGWRIDYVLANAAAMSFVRDAFILSDVKGSDHCPVGVDVDPAIFGDDLPKLASDVPSDASDDQTSLL